MIRSLGNLRLSEEKSNFKRARFNKRIQQDDESVEQFITCLYSLFDNCDFGDLREAMIRDCIVIGVRDQMSHQHI